MRTALRAFHDGAIATEEGLRWLWLAGRAAGFVWDYERLGHAHHAPDPSRPEAGALAHLPLAFSTRVGVHLFAGETRAAASLVDEADALAEATDGRVVPPYGRSRWPPSAAVRTKSRGWSEPARRTSPPAARGWDSRCRSG